MNDKILFIPKIIFCQKKRLSMNKYDLSYYSISQQLYDYARCITK